MKSRFNLKSFLLVLSLFLIGGLARMSAQILIATHAFEGSGTAQGATYNAGTDDEIVISMAGITGNAGNMGCGGTTYGVQGSTSLNTGRYIRVTATSANADIAYVEIEAMTSNTRKMQYNFSNTVANDFQLTLTKNCASYQFPNPSATPGVFYFTFGGNTGGSGNSQYSAIRVYKRGAACTNSGASFASSSLNKTTADVPFTENLASNSNTGTATWSSSDQSVATVNATTGEVTIVDAGTTVIRVEIPETNGVCAVDVTYTLNVSAAPVIRITPDPATGFDFIQGEEPPVVTLYVSGENIPAGDIYISPTNFHFSTSPTGPWAFSGPTVIADFAGGTLPPTPFYVKAYDGALGGAPVGHTYGGSAKPIVCVANTMCTNLLEGATVQLEAEVLAAPTGPTLTVTPTVLTGLDYVFGAGPSAVQSFNISGALLTLGSSIYITAPAGFEISGSPTGVIPFGATLTISPIVDPTLSAIPIYVRLIAGQAVSAAYAGNITVTGGGDATVYNVAVSGAVTPVGGGSADCVGGTPITTVWNFNADCNADNGTNLDATGEATRLGSALSGAASGCNRNSSKLRMKRASGGWVGTYDATEALDIPFEIAANKKATVSSISLNIASGSGTAATGYQMQYSTDGGATFTDIAEVTGTGDKAFAFTNPVTFEGITVIFRFMAKGSSSNSRNLDIDNITINGTTCNLCELITVASFDEAGPIRKIAGETPFTNAFRSDNASAKVWTSSDTSVATVNATTGEVTILTAGTTVITVAQVRDGYYCAVNENYTLNVTPAPNIGNKTPAVNSGQPFTIMPADGVDGDVVPAGTIYTWTVVSDDTEIDDTSVSDETTGVSVISQTPVNLTDMPQTVTYTVMPKIETSTPGVFVDGQSFTVTVTVNPQPRIADMVIGGAAAICTNAAFTVTPATGGGAAGNDIVPAGTTYTWTVATNTVGATDETVPQTTISQTLTNTGDSDETAVYTVMATSGTATTQFTITVTVTASPAPTVTDGGYITSCLRNGIANWADLVTATGTLKWYDNETDLVETAVTPTTFDKNTVTPVGGISYYVSKTTINGCESDRTQVTVDITDNPPFADVSSPFVACTTDAAAVKAWADLVNTAGTYTWYTAPTIATAVNPADINLNVVLPTTSYWVVVEDNTGCVRKPTEVTATVNAVPEFTVDRTKNVTCPGGNDGEARLVTISNYDTSLSYTNSWKNELGVEVSTAISPNNLTAGNYTLTVTDSNLCAATSAPVEIEDGIDTENPVVLPSALTAIADYSSNDCTFRVVDFTSAAKGVSTDNCTASADLIITQTPAVGTEIIGNTMVSITISDLFGNEVTTTAEVTLPEMPVITFNPIDDICANDAPIVIMSSNSTSDATSFAGTFTGEGVDVNGTFDPSLVEAGTYAITYTIAPYGCIMTATQNITVNPVPENVSVITPSVCPHESLTFTASADFGNTYEWTIDGVEQEETGSTFVYKEEKTPEQIINISLVAVSDKGCKAAPLTTFAITKPVPSIALAAQPIFCMEEYGTKINWRDLVIPSNGLISWFEDEEMQKPVVAPANIDQSVPGTHILYAAAANPEGCLSKAIEVMVTVHPKPLISNINTSDLKNIVVTVAGGTKPYVYQFDGTFGSTDARIYLGALAIGKNILLVTDLNGCQLEATVPVLETLVVPDTFFSPNGDGYGNERWNIANIDQYRDDDTTIRIFDRDGKILFEADARNFTGWDGTFNGRELPSTDYWYVITIGKLDKIYSGNVTLKR